MSRDYHLDDDKRDKRDDHMRDDGLSTLYRAHLKSAAPSLASDAVVMTMARNAMSAASMSAAAPHRGVVLPARAAATRSGWRAWLSAPWFGPGLAFATVASLSVVVIALMPKEEMAVEKEVASTPAASAPAAISALGASAPVASSAASSNVAAAAPATSRSRSTSSSDVTASSSLSSAAPPISPASASSAALARANESRAKVAANDARMATNEASIAPPLAMSVTSGGRAAPVDTRPAGPAEPTRREITSERNPLAATPAPMAMPAATATTSMRADATQALRRERGQPNAFPAEPQQQQPSPALAGATASPPSSPPPSLSRSSASPPSPPPATAFPEGARPEKQSLQSESIESRIQAPIAEVPDSAPTYPNESRPSIPLPYSYTMPRKSRDASASAVTPRVVEKTEKSDAPSLAAAAIHRDPAEWVKAILKLKNEGKTEELTKELADFRKQYPQYVLPEELRQVR